MYTYEDMEYLYGSFNDSKEKKAQIRANLREAKEREAEKKELARIEGLQSRK